MKRTPAAWHRKEMGRFALVVVVLAGCGYKRGSFYMDGVGSHPPKRVSLGCLDLGIGLDHFDPKPASPALRIAVANGCDDRIRVNLAALHVEGRDDAGNRTVLAPVNAPWLGPRNLGARWWAREVIHYAPAQKPVAELTHVCVDVARVHATDIAEHWLCVSLETVS